MEEVIEEENRINGTDYRVIDSLPDGNFIMHLGTEIVERYRTDGQPYVSPEVAE